MEDKLSSIDDLNRVLQNSIAGGEEEGFEEELEARRVHESVRPPLSQQVSGKEERSEEKGEDLKGEPNRQVPKGGLGEVEVESGTLFLLPPSRIEQALMELRKRSPGTMKYLRDHGLMGMCRLADIDPHWLAYFSDLEEDEPYPTQPSSPASASRAHTSDPALPSSPLSVQ